MDFSCDWTDQDVLKWTESAAELQSKASSVCDDLISQRYDIVQVVDRLGPILTSKDPDTRRKGLQFKTHLLSTMDNAFLQENQLKFILAFYHDRLRDHHSLVPYVLSGILSMSKMDNAAPEDVLRLLLAILSGSIISCQSLQREERGTIFDLIMQCSLKFHKQLLERRADYVIGVINAIEGERDPRNLVKLFEFMPQFIRLYPLENWAEEMFEVFACYYPIDFYPSANDPNAITRDGLAEKLGRCLVASADFVEPAIVLALEKLETDLKVAKLDSLKLIQDLCIKFGSAAIEDKFENVWLGLKQELLPGSNDDVIAAGLRTIETIVAESKEPQTLQNVTTAIFSSIAISLCDVNLRLFYPALRVANAVANASPESAVFIGDKVTPIFLRQLAECEEGSDEKQSVLRALVKDTISLLCKKKVLDRVDNDCIRNAETVFVECLSKADENTRVIGYMGLTDLCPRTTKETRETFYKNLIETLTNGNVGKIPIQSCLKGFVGHYEEEVLQAIVEPIIREPHLITTSNCNGVFTCFATLLGPCKMESPQIYQFIVDFMLKFDETTLNMDDEVEGDFHSRILLQLLNSINVLLEDPSNGHVREILYRKHSLVHELVELKDRFRCDFLLKPLSTLVKHQISAQGVEEQTKVISDSLSTLKLNNRNDLYFISGLLAECSNEVPLDERLQTLIPELVQLSLSGGSPAKTRACDQLLCFLFNRNNQDSVVFESILERAIGDILESVDKNGNGIETLSWITKGLLARGHPKAEGLIEKMIGFLEVPSLSSTTADAFEFLAKEPEFRLPNQRMFYKQKLFDVVFKNLKGGSSEGVQIKAISRILGEVSPVVIRMHLGKVGPVLFRCLDHQDPRTVQTSLKLIMQLIGSDAKFCQDHLQFLIPQLLKLTQFVGDLRIRVLSLECLLSVCSYPTYLLVPFKQDVLYGTVAALDDHKRLVRVAAVRTRTRWFLIDSPIKEK